MANPASNAVLNTPTLLDVGNSVVAIALNPDRDYVLINTGLDSSGAGVLTVLRGAVNTGTAPADLSAGTDRFALPAGASIPIGPGVQSLALIAAATIKVSLAPGARWMGRF